MQNHLLCTGSLRFPPLHHVAACSAPAERQTSKRREADLVDVGEGAEVGSMPAPHDFHFALEVAR